MLFPAVAVTTQIISGLRDRFGCRRIALQRQRTRKNSQWELALLEKAMNTPEANPAPVFKLRFGSKIPAFNTLWTDFGKGSFADAVTVGKGRLRSLLKIHYKIDGKPCVI